MCQIFLCRLDYGLGAGPSGISGPTTPLGAVLHPFKFDPRGPSVGTVPARSRKFDIREVHALLASQRMLSDRDIALTGPEMQLEKLVCFAQTAVLDVFCAEG